MNGLCLEKVFVAGYELQVEIFVILSTFVKFYVFFQTFFV